MNRKRALAAMALFLACAAGLPAAEKKVVLISPGTPYNPIGPAEIRDMEAYAPGVRIVMPAQGRLLAELADADGALGQITREMFLAAKKLQWVQVFSAGVEPFIAIPELRDSNVTLTNCKITQGPEIADHAFAMLLALTRDLHRIIPRRTLEEWTTRNYHPLELQGKTAVVVGVGGIGMQIAVRAHAFGMKVIGVDPKDISPVPLQHECVCFGNFVLLREEELYKRELSHRPFQE